MQEKIINRFLILLFIVTLTACSSLHVSRQAETDSSGNNKDVFVDPSIAQFMGISDHIKLQSLIATAQPEQFISWYSAKTGAHFEFISKRIFVNPKGEGCRNYQVKMNKGFFEHRMFSYTACRDSQGDWRVTKF